MYWDYCQSQEYSEYLLLGTRNLFRSSEDRPTHYLWTLRLFGGHHPYQMPLPCGRLETCWQCRPLVSRADYGDDHAVEHDDEKADHHFQMPQRYGYDGSLMTDDEWMAGRLDTWT